MEEVIDVDHTSEVLDEVLQQTSAHALRISHVDESLNEVKQSLAELMARPVGASAPAASGGESHAAIEHLEHEVKSLKGKLGVLMGLCGLQILLSGALVLFAFKPMPAQVIAEQVEAPHVAAPPPPAPAPKAEVTESENLLQPAAAPTPPAAPAKPSKKKKK